jgi:hypothetical protein
MKRGIDAPIAGACNDKSLFDSLNSSRIYEH